MAQFDYTGRIRKTRELMEEKGIDIILSFYSRNNYWLTGTAQHGRTLLTPDEGPIFFCIRNIHRARDEVFNGNVVELGSTRQLAEFIERKLGGLEGKKIGVEFSILPTSFYLYLKKVFAGAEIVDSDPVLRYLRMFKDEKEKELLREAGRRVMETQRVVREMAAPGVSEKEIAAEMLRVAKLNENDGVAYYNAYYANNFFIVAGGENTYITSDFPIMSGRGFSPAVPHGQSNRKLTESDILVVDYAVLYRGYHADHCRTYYTDPIPEKFAEYYSILKHAYECGLDYLRDGEEIGKIWAVMKKELEKEGLARYFQGDGKYYQGLGHGIGLELDEPPFLLEKTSGVFRENMVISVEPKIIIPGWGAVNFEDNFIVTKGKPELLTPSPYYDF